MGPAGALSGLSSGLSVVGSVMGGTAGARGAEFEAQQADNAATIGRTQAAQTSTAMTYNLDRQIANIQAIRGAAGVEDTSPTGEAVINSVRARGQEQIGIRVGNIERQADQDQAAAAFYNSAASNALIGGILGGAGSLASGIWGAFATPAGPISLPAIDAANADFRAARKFGATY